MLPWRLIIIVTEMPQHCGSAVATAEQNSLTSTSQTSLTSYSLSARLPTIPCAFLSVLCNVWAAEILLTFMACWVHQSVIVSLLRSSSSEAPPTEMYWSTCFLPFYIEVVIWYVTYQTLGTDLSINYTMKSTVYIEFIILVSEKRASYLSNVWDHHVVCVLGKRVPFSFYDNRLQIMNQYPQVCEDNILI